MKKAKIRRCKLEVVGKRYFDITHGFFTVKKAWSITEYNNNAINLDGTHIFRSTNLLIVTDNGVKYIFPSWRLSDSLKQEYPKRHR
jgi:hypothetical protein